MTLPRLFRAMSATCITLSLASCGDSTSQNADKEGKKARPKKRDQLVLEQPEDLAKRIEVLSGGAQTKVIWAWHQNQKQADTYAVGENHVLAGIDTRDGRGARVILQEPGNYTRPMISKRGQWILYSDKNVDRKKSGTKHYAPVIYKVNWDGEDKTELAEGLALDTWIDPETKIEWGYALRDLDPSPRAAVSGSNLFRFQLEDPSKSEEVWPGLEMSSDNFQLSRDGKKAAGLFPWPEAGIADLPSKSVTRTENGCWTSMAPDDSYVNWVFDGLHKNLRLFTGDGSRTWPVNLSKIGGIDGHEVYHPRWSNHARFFTMTGPYIHEEKGENAISKGGKEAEVFLVKFNADYDAVEGWIKLTSNDTGDSYPDAWISTGDESYVSLPEAEPEPVAEAGIDGQPYPWPSKADGLVFKWENVKADNSVDAPGEPGERRICRFHPHSLARYSSYYEMAIDGAYFVADDASNLAIAKACAASGEATIEAVIAETMHGDLAPLSTRLLSYGNGEDFSFALFRLRHELTCQLRLGGANGTGGREYNIPLGSLHIDNGRPFHIVLTVKGNEVVFYLDGQFIDAKKFDRDSTGGWSAGQLIAGDPETKGAEGWTGRVEGVAIFSRALDRNEAHSNYLHVRDKVGARHAIKKFRLRGKLVEATPLPTPEAIEPYARGLVDYTYEVEEVISGRYPHPKMVVLHWAVLDRKPAPGVPREPGKTYDLLVESIEDHPQLRSERTESGTSEFNLPLFYDATTPGTDPTITDPNDEENPR